MKKEDMEKQLILSLRGELSDMLEYIVLEEKWENREQYKFRVNGSYIGASEMLDRIRNKKRHAMQCLRKAYDLYIARIQASDNPSSMTSKYIHFKKREQH